MRLGCRPQATRLVPVLTVLALCPGSGIERNARAEESPPAAAEAAPTAATPPPYWQAPALPNAVIHAGPIPAGWQPQAVPYQGVGPDGRPLTMYFAPTYVFTYPIGPPMPAVPRVTRRPPPTAPASAPYGAYGWNYQSQGATAVPVALPPATGPRPQPIPYQFPPDARALGGTPVMPPAP